MNKTKTLWIAALALACIFALWRSSHENGPNEALEPTQSAPSDESPPPAVPSTNSPSGTRSRIDELLPTRVALDVADPAELHGWVVSPDELPLAGAEISWTPKSVSIQAALTRGQRPSVAAVAEATTRAVTDANGRFAIERRSPQLEGVLWVTLAGYSSTALTLAADHKTELKPTTLVPAPAFSCRVLRGEQEVAGVLVTHTARGASEAFEPDEVALFLRSVRSQPTGYTPLGPTGLEELLRAQTDRELTEPWSGPAREGIELELQPTFFVSGSVTPGARAWTVAPQGHLSLWEERGLSKVCLSDDSEVIGGAFTSVAFPVPSAGSCMLRFEAPGFVPSEALLGGIVPGAQVSVSLQVEPATRFKVQAMYWESDEIPDRPAEGAAVHCFWTDENNRLVEVVRTADSEGIASFDNLPNSTVTCWPIKPGMAGLGVWQFALPWQEPEPPVVWLTPSGQLSGTCTIDGKPAPDFDIRVWSLPMGDKQARLEVRASEDGAFTIDNAPYGEIAIVATSPEGRRSAELNMLLEEGNGSAVELELHEQSLVTGRVRLLPDKRPPGEGWIVPLMSAGRTSATTAHGLTTLGTDFPIKPDGSFSAPLAVPGANTIQVDVPGYSPLVHSFEASTDGLTDLGDLLLEERCSVEFTIKTAAGKSPSDFDLYMFGIEAIPFQRVPISGRVRFPSIAASAWSATLHDRETYVDTTNEFALSPGSKESYLIDLSGSSKVTVVLTAPGPDAIPDGIFVQINGRDAQGEPFRIYKTLSGDTEVTFEGLAPGDASILACMPDGSAPRASLSFTIQPDDKEVTYTLELSGTPTNCEIVNSAGMPLPGVMVSLLDATSGTPFEYMRVTDSQGRCTFVGVNEQFTEVRLTGPTGEVVEGLPADLKSGERELNTIIMDASRSIVVQLMDAGVPLGAAAVSIKWPLRPSNSSQLKHPDAAGLVRFEGLGKGEYELSVASNGHIAASYMIATSLEQQPTQVEVPLQVSQTIQVFTHEGDPAKGIQLEFLLQLPEAPRPLFSMNLREWVEAGTASSNPTGMKTDGAGRLQLNGIARGGYSWSTAAGNSGFVKLTGKPVTIVLQ